MTATPKLWKSLTLVNTRHTGDQFDGQIAAVNAPILDGRRASLLPTVAFRLWAAANICLATDGATAESVDRSASDLCGSRPQAHHADRGARRGPRRRRRSFLQAFFTVMEARKACNEGQVEADDQAL